MVNAEAGNGSEREIMIKRLFVFHVSVLSLLFCLFVFESML